MDSSQLLGVMDSIGPNFTLHHLGGRDGDDPLSHMTVARSPKGWHCPQCLHTSTTKGNLKSHILSGRHKLSEKSFVCHFCHKNYSTRQSLQVHISTHHRRKDTNGPAGGSTTEDDARTMNPYHLRNQSAADMLIQQDHHHQQQQQQQHLEQRRMSSTYDHHAASSAMYNYTDSVVGNNQESNKEDRTAELASPSLDLSNSISTNPFRNSP